MRLPGRVHAAIEVIEQLERQHRPLNLVLRDWGSQHRFAGSKDRHFINALVMEVLRWRAASLWLLGQESARVQVIGGLFLGWNWTVDALQEAFTGEGFGAAVLTPGEVQALDKSRLSDAPLPARACLQPWIADRFQAQFGEAAYAEGAAFCAPATLDLRINPAKTARAEAKSALAYEKAEPIDGLALALRIPAPEPGLAPPALETIRLFLEGGFEVQDAGSQWAAKLGAHRRPKRVLDLCAGGGGKSLALRAELGPDTEIHLYDQDPRRLAPLFARLQRVGEAGFVIHEPRRDKRSLLPDSLLSAAPFDLVFVDAPCTGTGIWRRRPQTKWQLSEKLLASRQGDQKLVLETAARLAGRQGDIVYVTCSVLDDENDAMVAHFLEKHAGFAALPPETLAITGALPEHWARQHGILLTPSRSGTDGFYLAYLQRGPKG